MIPAGSVVRELVNTNIPLHLGRQDRSIYSGSRREESEGGRSDLRQTGRGGLSDKVLILCYNLSPLQNNACSLGNFQMLQNIKIKGEQIS